MILNKNNDLKKKRKLKWKNKISEHLIDFEKKRKENSIY